MVAGGVSGLWWISSEGNSEKNWHQLGIAASVKTGKISPGVSLRIPVDKSLTETLNLVFGLNVAVNI